VKTKQNNGIVSSSKGRENTKICMQYEEIGQDSEESVWHNFNKWRKICEPRLDSDASTQISMITS